MVQPDWAAVMPPVPVSWYGVARPGAESGLAGTMMLQLTLATAAGAEVVADAEGDGQAVVLGLAEAVAVVVGVTVGAAVAVAVVVGVAETVGIAVEVGVTVGVGVVLGGAWWRRRQRLES